MAKRVLYYLNQFFGQIGGEEKADIGPEYREGGVGPSAAFSNMIEDGELVGTIICGDNYINENREEALDFLEKAYQDLEPDILVAGPAFNAGRYGVACAIACKFFNEKGVDCISGMYEENPGLDQVKKYAYTVKTGNSAASMRDALPAMAEIAGKLIQGKDLDPSIDDYFPQGQRRTILVDKIGSERAIDMLMKRLQGLEIETELPMPVFDSVDPAPAIKDLSEATIALVTSGGIVPKGNPDRIQSASAQIWGKYDVEGLDKLAGDFCTIHGGYDPVYANEKPDRVAPLDLLKKMEKEGKIGKVYKYFYTTTGTGTSVANAKKFGKEIGKELKEAGVDGVILTST